MTWIDVIWGFYLVPTVVAWLRFHTRAPEITAINVLAGWTLIGWAVALVWAIRGQARPPAIRSVDRSERPGDLAGALFVWALLGVPAFLVAMFLALAGGGAETGSTSELLTVTMALLWVLGWPVAVIAIVKSVQRWRRGLDPLPWGEHQSEPRPQLGSCPSCGQPVFGGRFCTACGTRLTEVESEVAHAVR